MFVVSVNKEKGHHHIVFKRSMSSNVTWNIPIALNRFVLLTIIDRRMSHF